jgi:hypothetical protein
MTQEHFPLLLGELLELSAHPVVALFFLFNTKTLDIGYYLAAGA